VSERIVPTAPGWWWREGNRGPLVRLVDRDIHGRLIHRGIADPLCAAVHDDGRWLTRLPSPSEARDLTAARDTAVAALTAALAEADRLRADLAACRGEDIGEWTEMGDAYYCGAGDWPTHAVLLHVDGVRWIPIRFDAEADTEAERGAPCAHILDAMAAALALGGGEPAPEVPDDWRPSSGWTDGMGPKWWLQATRGAGFAWSLPCGYPDDAVHTAPDLRTAQYRAEAALRAAGEVVP
jgi:hypothetical protein